MKITLVHRYRKKGRKCKIQESQSWSFSLKMKYSWFNRQICITHTHTKEWKRSLWFVLLWIHLSLKWFISENQIPWTHQPATKRNDENLKLDLKEIKRMIFYEQRLNVFFLLGFPFKHKTSVKAGGGILWKSKESAAKAKRWVILLLHRGSGLINGYQSFLSQWQS